MSAAVVGPSTARIRIKGRWRSVIRFFFIAVGFMMTWVLITSELHYYARWFGPSILLELNFAFYLPSIPILLVSGQLEKYLDSSYGPIMSMVIRLNVCLAGTAAICAAFPFIARTHESLLWITALLGTLSAVAFSTSYQLVQWFRHADIIGLGIGGVGCGPLVLLIQLALVQFKAWPERWQWIAMFEITAAIVSLGLLSSLSLFGQYWGVLTGVQPYEDPRKPPLLSNSMHPADVIQPLLGDDYGSRDAEAGEMMTARTMPTGSPQGAWFPVELLSPEEVEEERQQGLAMAPSQSIFLAPDPWNGGFPVLFRSSLEGRERLRNQKSLPALLTPRPHTVSEGGGPRLAPSSEGKSSLHHSNSVVLRGKQRWSEEQEEGHLPFAPSFNGLAASAVLDDGTATGEAPSADTVGHDTVSPFAFPAAQDHQLTDGIDSPCTPRPPARYGVPEPDPLCEGRTLTLAEETWATLGFIWPVLAAFLVSVSVMYMVRSNVKLWFAIAAAVQVFPFFTYIPSSGFLGDALPRVLFFTRIGSDIIGRFAPRYKAIVTHSPGVLFLIAMVKVAVATVLILYIQMAPANLLNDWFPVGIVIFLWTSAGYVNTCANMLAPALVPDALCARASALMALTFQIAHFTGLVLAALLVFVMYGDIAG